MGEVLPLHKEQSSTGIEKVMKPVYAYRTADGKEFSTLEEAEAHQAKENFLDKVYSNYRDGVGGWTCRGTGLEFVHAERKRVKKFLRYAFEQWEQIKG